MLSQTGDPERIKNFDTDIYLFAFTDKVVDLRTVTCRNISKHDNICRNTGYHYPQKLRDDKPRWDRVRAELMAYLESLVESKEVAYFLLCNLARLMIGMNPYEEAIFLTGHGHNGKTLFINFAVKIFGGAHNPKQSMGAQLHPNYFIKASGDTDPELITIVNSRFVMTSEPEVKGAFQCEKFKTMTGGDVVSGRPLYSNDIVYKNMMGTMWFAMNSVPEIPGANYSIQRRIKRIIFPHNFDPEKKDHASYHEGYPDVINKLETDEWRDGMVLLMLETYKDVIMGCEFSKKHRKYTVPHAVKSATEQIMDDNSPFKDFAQLRIQKTDNKKNSMSLKKVFKEYVGYTRENKVDKALCLKKGQLRDIIDMQFRPGKATKTGDYVWKKMLYNEYDSDDDDSSSDSDSD